MFRDASIGHPGCSQSYLSSYYSSARHLRNTSEVVVAMKTRKKSAHMLVIAICTAV